MIRMMLVGNPNSGKTTLFNALTGENQRVGNWPGVTVEKKMGRFTIRHHSIQLIDLPGLYSLSTLQEGSSIDEKITASTLITEEFDHIINVIDACQLERHLYLTTQLFELGKPITIVLNMVDIAAHRGIVIDAQALSKILGCNVVCIQAHREIGIHTLKAALVEDNHIPAPLKLDLPSNIQNALTTIESDLMVKGNVNARCAFYGARRLLEGDGSWDTKNAFKIPTDSDIWMADARYQMVHHIVTQVQTKQSDASEYLTSKIDRIVLHRFWALPIFFSIMYLMFFFAINLGTALQDFFDISTDAIFVQGTDAVFQMFHTPEWLRGLIANGVGKGINTTLTFIPVIASMYFFLAILETSGYMARAAFVVDKVMRLLGLPGKAFVPMIVGFGCNVPAIMAARTLDSERDQLLTVVMSPFMSCSARLAIYAIFVAAFFPVGGHNIVFSLYLIGILVAVFTGWLLRKSVFHGNASPLLLELPAYHKPSLHRLLKETRIRLSYFIIRAGQFIIPVCVVLEGLNILKFGHHGDSIMSIVGHWLTPLFSPMGMHTDNWPAIMGLLTGTMAKEVVVGTLQTLYSQVGHLTHDTTAHFDLGQQLWAAVMSIPQNLLHFGQMIIHPFSAHSPKVTLTSDVEQVMVQYFDGKIGAYAYLLFVLLYIPCVSTMATIRQEAGNRLMWFSIVWSLLLAYGSAVGFYQIATWNDHPAHSLIWVFIIILGMGIVIRTGRSWCQLGARHVIQTA